MIRSIAIANVLAACCLLTPVAPAAADGDGDGFEPCGAEPTPGCDCDDTSPAIHSDAVEITDGLDNDCDGYIDTWVRLYGFSGRDLSGVVFPAHDGGYVLSGYSQGPQTAIVKTDPDGVVDWFISRDEIDGKTSMVVGGGAQTDSGGYVFVGVATDILLQWPVERRVPHMGLMTVDGDGNILMHRRYSRSLTVEEMTGVAQTESGGYVAVGMRRLGDGDRWAATLIGFDAAGEILWKRLFGAFDFQRFNDVIATDDGGGLAVGRASRDGESGALAVRVDAEGEVEWTRLFSDIPYADAARIIKVPEGGFLVSGSADTAPSVRGGWLLRLDDEGRRMWEDVYAAGGHSDGDALEHGYGAAALETGGFVLVGTHDPADSDVNDCFFREVDAQGALLRYHVLAKPYPDHCRSIFPLADGGVVMGGYGKGKSYDESFESDEDFMLVRADADGQAPTWVVPTRLPVPPN